jgi:hypothetical protein
MKFIEYVDRRNIRQTQAGAASAAYAAQMLVSFYQIASLAHKSVAQAGGALFTEVFTAGYARKYIQ